MRSMQIRSCRELLDVTARLIDEEVAVHRLAGIHGDAVFPGPDGLPIGA